MSHNKLIVRLRELMRRGVRIFDWHSNRDCEYNFALRQILGEGGKVLDVGGAESLLPLVFAKRNFEVIVYDFRKYPERHKNIESIQGDFLQNNLPSGSFDYVVMISTIEHIGFGSYGCPICKDGDIVAMSEVKRIVKSDGKIVLTFPFTGKGKSIKGFERWYDITRVKQLFEGLYILNVEYYIPNYKLITKWVDWRAGSLKEIQQVEEKFGCSGFACYTVSPVSHLNKNNL